MPCCYFLKAIARASLLLNFEPSGGAEELGLVSGAVPWQVTRAVLPAGAGRPRSVRNVRF